MTVFLTILLFITALGWTRERALRKGDLTRLAEAGTNLELAAEREEKLLQGVHGGILTALITINGAYRSAFGSAAPEPHPDDDPAATRH